MKYKKLDNVMESGDHFKNGASSKSHTKRINCLLVITVIAMVMFSMVACGRVSKIPNGTYENADVSATFSGNKYKWTQNNVTNEGAYKLVEEYKEKGVSSGAITLEINEVGIKSNITFSYLLEGNKLSIGGTLVGNKLMDGGNVLIKK